MKVFEDFIGRGGDIFVKAEAFHNAVCAGELPLKPTLGHRIQGAADTVSTLSDASGLKEVLMFGSNSYLNLTSHPQVVCAAKEACERYGYGAGAVSLYAGMTDLHRELELLIARFYQTEDALVLPSGYGSNVGLIAALCQPGDVIVNDAFNHASIFDGCKLSGAEVKIYPHANMAGLERILSRIPDSVKGRLIVTDGVFSMHGDVAPLDQITALAQRYGARVMVDDAHGIGVVGPSGRGSAEVFGLTHQIDLHAGVLSKAPGGLGGFCAGKKAVINYLRYYTRSYFFSTALPASVVAGLIEVFKLLEDDRAGRQQLMNNVAYLKQGLSHLGFTIGNSASGIVPVVIGHEDKLIALHQGLYAKGLYCNIVTYPAVRRKECRLRLCVMSSMKREQLDRAIHIFASEGERLGLIQKKQAL